MRHQKVLKTIGNTKGSKCLRQPNINPTNGPGKWAQGGKRISALRLRSPGLDMARRETKAKKRLDLLIKLNPPG